MNYHNIVYCDFANNLEGVGITLFVSGCNHKCKNCQNPQTWDPNSGIPFSNETKEEIFRALCDKNIKAFTISGGDPFYPSNRDEILNLVKDVKSKFPEKKIWVYTGYLYEEIKNEEILKYVDVLVDGPFIEEQRDRSCIIKGSKNQRVISLKDGKYLNLIENT